MIEGAMRHGTTMDVEANYTDTHGQSVIGFGMTRLLGFDLLPRIKPINRVRLYRPGRRRPRPLPAPDPRAEQADPLGPDRRPVRRDDQVRHGDPYRAPP